MDIFHVLTMLGGLCLFLFGMNFMGQSLERRAGGKLRTLLDKMTGSVGAGFLTGLGITAIIQSSSATTVMVVGFVNSGLMNLRQAINVIMGANVGTTVTAWLLSLAGIDSGNVWIKLLKPTSFTPVLALIGIIFYMFCKDAKKKDTGMILLGFATLMFGMDTMSGAVAGLKDMEGFRELLVRWFAWGCFCPVFRMHGERSPWYEREQEFINGVRQLTSGQDNEVWSFGEDNYEILKKYLFVRENLRPYMRKTMDECTAAGTPVMRPLWFEFPEDSESWNIEDEYTLGSALLVAPVTEAEVKERSVYLPGGTVWRDANTGTVYKGGQRVTVPAPLDVIPVFVRDNAEMTVF